MKPQLGHAPMPVGIERDGVDWGTDSPRPPRPQRISNKEWRSLRQKARIQEWQLEQEELALLRARATELGRIIAEDKRRVAEREEQHAIIVQRVRDLAHSEQIAQKLWGGSILAEIRARRRARKLNKKLMRKQR